MANHVLSLEVPTVMNACTFVVMDTSVYADIVPVTCPTLNITVPGFNYSNQIDFVPGSTSTLTACDLGLQTENCDGGPYLNFPDGVYVVRYSVSPNETVYVEYNHLRITEALNMYNELLCDLDVADCQPEKAVQDKLKTLRMIRVYLDAAKAKVEYCHEPDKGMIIYNYALKLMKKLNCNNC
jgi:hypothetical protein